MQGLKKVFDENRKKIIALILVLLLGALGINVSQDTQDDIVNTIDSVVPDLADETPAEVIIE